MDRKILVIPEKTDIEFEQVFESWTDKGGVIKRLGKYWIKDDYLDRQNISIYGNQTFALILSQIYNVDLISPDDKLVARIDNKWTKRKIEIKTIADIDKDSFPIFIKPVTPKAFIAGVFKNADDFDNTLGALEKNEEVLESNVIEDIKAEARAYVKNGIIKDIAFYEGNSNINEGNIFLQNFIEKHLELLPEVVVIDIAYSESLGWLILEFNACWGAGLNNCKADKVIDCIIDATKDKK